MSVPPVFFKHIGVEERTLSTYEVCYAAERESGENSIEGSQRIGACYRLYVKDKRTRVRLLSTGLEVRGQRVELLPTNPFLVRDGDAEVELTRLYISNVPISYADAEIEKALRKVGVDLRSPLRRERARDPEGRLTNWITGRRMVEVVVPQTPLPKILDVGLFKAHLFHREMKAEMVCRRCLQKGHLAAKCQGVEVCLRCKKAGHRAKECKTPWGRREEGERSVGGERLEANGGGQNVEEQRVVTEGEGWRLSEGRRRNRGKKTWGSERGEIGEEKNLCSEEESEQSSNGELVQSGGESSEQSTGEEESGKSCGEEGDLIRTEEKRKKKKKRRYVAQGKGERVSRKEEVELVWGGFVRDEGGERKSGQENCGMVVEGECRKVRERRRMETKNGRSVRDGLPESDEEVERRELGEGRIAQGGGAKKGEKDVVEKKIELRGNQRKEDMMKRRIAEVAIEKGAGELQRGRRETRKTRWR